MDTDTQEAKTQIQERFAQLPKVVQEAVTSANIQKHLRDLATTHKLHLDQWEKLENQVMLTLLGFENSGELQTNIQNEIRVPAETAKMLAADISATVFEPIRQELERGLEAKETAPESAPPSQTPAAPLQQPVNEVGQTNAAPQKEVAPAAAVPAQQPAQEPQQGTPLAIPATPPAQAPSQKATRPPESTAYKGGEPSTARRSVDDDPYREPLS